MQIRPNFENRIQIRTKHMDPDPQPCLCSSNIYISKYWEKNIENIGHGIRLDSFFSQKSRIRMQIRFFFFLKIGSGSGQSKSGSTSLVWVKPCDLWRKFHVGNSDGNSEIGAHWTEGCLRHIFRSRAVTEKNFFLTRALHVLSYHLI